MRNLLFSIILCLVIAFFPYLSAMLIPLEHDVAVPFIIAGVMLAVIVLIIQVRVFLDTFEEPSRGTQCVLVKLSHDGDTPNPHGIHAGYTKRSVYTGLPKVGYSYWFGGLSTTLVIKIISQKRNEIVFKTLNSTYKLTVIG